MVSIKTRSNGKTCVRSKLNFFEKRVVLTKDGFKQDINGRRFQKDSSWYILYSEELPVGDYEAEINGNEMKLLGFNWKEVHEEHYGHVDDGSMKSKFRATVYNEGYRPDEPSTWDKLRKWFVGTPSMSQKDKAEALGESEYKIRKKCGM